VRGAGHGEVLPSRFLREPRQGQHQLTEYRVPRSRRTHCLWLEQFQIADYASMACNEFCEAK